MGEEEHVEKRTSWEGCPKSMKDVCGSYRVRANTYIKATHGSTCEVRLPEVKSSYAQRDLIIQGAELCKELLINERNAGNEQALLSEARLRCYLRENKMELFPQPVRTVHALT